MAIHGFGLTKGHYIKPQLANKIGGGQSENLQREFTKSLREARSLGVKRWYELGGEYLLEWVKANHKTNEGEPLRWDECFAEEYYLLLGNPWVVRLIVEKASQMGYSESLIAMAAFLVAEIRIPSAMGFEVSSKVSDMVGDRVQPSFDYCTQIKQLRLARSAATGRKDTDTRRRKMTIGGVPLTFFYAGTVSSKSDKSNKSVRQASSAMSSFTAWAILGDEIELWPVGALDIAAERQSACPMETKPFRGGSTPGQEGGVVDAQIKSSAYIFEWYLTCPHCNHEQAISALGNLIKPVMISNDDGGEEETYLDVSGRPYDWFASDLSTDKLKISTAYIGCQKCGKELDRVSIDAGCFKTKSGVKLRHFCKQIIKYRIPIPDTVALRLPRLASRLFNAPERIRTLMTTLNTADQLQQGLGLAISVGGGKISLPKMLACVGLPNALVRQTELSYSQITVVGCDQGVALNYYVVQRWTIPDEGTWEERWLKAFIEVIEYGKAQNFADLFKVGQKHKAHLIGMDNEPEISLAGTFARQHPLKPMKKILLSIDKPEGLVVLMDQVGLSQLQYKRSQREVQGVKFPVYSIDRTFGLDQVRNRIYQGRYSLPVGTDHRPGDNDNFMYHFLTSDRKPDGKWVEPNGVPDHWFHADNFAQMAVLVANAEPTSGFFFDGIDRP